MKKLLHFFQREPREHQKGLTIVEMLLYMGLFSILLVVLSQVFVAIVQTKLETQGNAAVDQDGRFLLSRFGYDVQHSTSITTPTTLGGTATSLVMVIGGVTNTYAVSGTTLQVTNGSGTNALTSPDSKISNFSVQRVGNASGKDTVRITFTLTSTAQQAAKSEQRSFQTTVGRR